ncbi:MAG: SocA family protein [Gemmatimonadetes bacterium]|nr:SocA family protein [Gemmatimonadota bacterium]
MHTALDVAAWFLNEIDRDAGDSITNLKLQKLVYYAQAWSLALLNRPLFGDVVEAWAHGPVVESVYQEYKRYGFDTLPRSRRRPRFAPQEQVILEDVLTVYGEHSAKFLENLTHQEEPWRQAWGDRAPTSRSRRPIPSDAMCRFYLNQYENREMPDAKVALDLMRQEPLEEGVMPLPPRPPGDDWEPDPGFLADAAASQRAIGRATGRGRGAIRA